MVGTLPTLTSRTLSFRCPANLGLCPQNDVKIFCLPTFSIFAQAPSFFAQTPFFFAQNPIFVQPSFASTLLGLWQLLGYLAVEMHLSEGNRCFGYGCFSFLAISNADNGR